MMCRFQLIHFYRGLVAVIETLAMLVFTDDTCFIYYEFGRMVNSVYSPVV